MLGFLVPARTYLSTMLAATLSVALALAVLAPCALGERVSYTQNLTGAFIPADDTSRTGAYMFGRGLAIGRAGSDVIAVGEAGPFGRGRVHIYRKNETTGGQFALAQTLMSPDNVLSSFTGSAVSPSFTTDRFGISLGLSADGAVLAVGAPRNGTNGYASATVMGVVYVYFSGGPSSPAYTLNRTLFAPTRMRLDKFGSIVQVSEDGSRIFTYTHAVRCALAWGTNCPPANWANRGVHVFARSSPTGAHTVYSRVQTPEPTQSFSIANGTFFQQSGQPFGISPGAGSTLWVLGFDVAYMNNTQYTRTLVHRYRAINATAWLYLGVVRAPTQAFSQQLFGAAIVLTGDGDDDEAFISAPRNDSTVFRYASGANGASGIIQPTETWAYGNAAIYDTSDSSDCAVRKAPWRTDSNHLGIAMALSPSQLLLAIGAPFGVDAEVGNGRVYLFRRYSVDSPFALVEVFRSQWVFSLVTTSYDPAIARGVIDEFGLDLALSDSTLVVGAKGASFVTIYADMARYLVQPPPPPPSPPPAPPPPPMALAEVVVVGSSRSTVLPFIIALILLLLLLIVALLVSRWAVRKIIQRRVMKRKMKSALDDDVAAPEDAAGGGDAGALTAM